MMRLQQCVQLACAFRGFRCSGSARLVRNRCSSITKDVREGSLGTHGAERAEYAEVDASLRPLGFGKHAKRSFTFIWNTNKQYVAWCRQQKKPTPKMAEFVQYCDLMEANGSSSSSSFSCQAQVHSSIKDSRWIVRWPFAIRWCLALLADIELKNIPASLNHQMTASSVPLHDKVKLVGSDLIPDSRKFEWQRITRGISASSTNEQGISYTAEVCERDARLFIQPLPPKVGSVKRFYAKYGSHRFISVSVAPYLRQARYKKDLRAIAQNGFQFADRSYELLVPRIETKNCGLQLFATTGTGLVGMHIQAVRNWHLPLCDENMHMSIPKYCSRFSLGFSDTIRTVVVDPTKVRHVDDIRSPSAKAVMTDGCAPVSQDIIDRVGDCYHAELSLSGQSKKICAFQGRLGSAKGMFYVDGGLPPETITLRDSMCKYMIAEPTKEQLCIEVNSVVNTDEFKPGRLNRQVIRLLEARGVPAAYFLKLQRKQVENIMSALYDRAAFKQILGRGKSSLDQVLHSVVMNHHLWNSWMCHSIRKQYLALQLKLIANESKLPVSQSIKCKILPDPTGELKPHQCYISLNGNPLRNMKILLARNPCYHPGELLLLHAVGASADSKLSALHNVVILSTQGKRPPADMMQGGDYDGDSVLAIYDRELTSCIQPWNPPTYKALGNSVAFPSLRESKDIENDLIDMWLSSIEDSKLGLLTNLHELWADIAASNWFTPAGKNAIQLAELSFNEMDAWKNGRRVTINHGLQEVDSPNYFRIRKGSTAKVRKSFSVISLLHMAANEAADTMEKSMGPIPIIDNQLKERARNCTQRNLVEETIRILKRDYASLRKKYNNEEITKSDLDEHVRNLIAQAQHLLFGGVSQEEGVSRAAAVVSYEIDQCAINIDGWRSRESARQLVLDLGQQSTQDPAPQFSLLVAEVISGYAKF